MENWQFTQLFNICWNWPCDLQSIKGTSFNKCWITKWIWKDKKKFRFRKKKFRIRYWYRNWTLVLVPNTVNWFRLYTNCESEKQMTAAFCSKWQNTQNVGVAFGHKNIFFIDQRKCSEGLPVIGSVFTPLGCQVIACTEWTVTHLIGDFRNISTI